MTEIVIDFETFWDTKQKYTLSKLSIAEYVSHPLFRVQGLGIQIGSQAPVWVAADDVEKTIKLIPWHLATVIAHNARFDLSVLSWRYGVKAPQYVDTQALAMAAYGTTIPKFSLRALGDLFQFPEKGELRTDGIRDLTPGQSAELGEYCKRDVEICRAIYDRLKGTLNEDQYKILDWTVRAFVEPKLDLDSKLAKEVAERLAAEKAAKIESLGLDKKILASNPKFAKLLELMGYKVPMKKNPKGFMIPALAAKDPEFIEMLNSENENLSLVCHARMAAKQTMEVSRATKLGLIDVGGKYPFDVVFSGAKQTHRFAGGNGAGGNPQNFPRKSELRSCIKAPAGCRLLVGDFDKIELRVNATLAGDLKLLADIADDPYSRFAEKIYGLPSGTINKGDESRKAERQLGKISVLGLGYGMGPAHFEDAVFVQTGVRLEKGRAWDIVQLFRGSYPFVPALWERCETVIRMMVEGQAAPFPGAPMLRIEKNSIVLPSGLRLQYPNLRRNADDEWEYDRYKYGRMKVTKLYGGYLTENLCQALAGELCKEAILRLIAAGFPPSGQVHDELLDVVPNEKVAEARDAMTAAMRTPPTWWPGIKLDLELGEGETWKQAK